jgi:transcriptional regulator with XRE-family HTH domain
MTISNDDKLFLERLGAHIAELRRQQGLTQVQLAEHLGVSQQTASLEKGRRRVPLSALPAIAKLLKVSVEELLNDEQQCQHDGEVPNRVPVDLLLSRC